MVSWNLGSAGTEIHNLVDDIPAAMSGASMWAIIDRKRLYIEEYTDLSIGSTGIAERFQPALLHLSVADILRYMNTIGADIQSISLGQLSVSKGGRSNLIESADMFEKMGREELKSIGGVKQYYKAFG